MTREDEVLSEKILDDLFYPSFDNLSSDDLKEDDTEENEILGVKSLNFK